MFCSPKAGFSFLLQHALRQAATAVVSAMHAFVFCFPAKMCDTQPGIYESSHLAGILRFTGGRAKGKSSSSDWRKEKSLTERQSERKTEKDKQGETGKKERARETRMKQKIRWKGEKDTLRRKLETCQKRARAA